jgi:hypothetical protein
MRATRPANTAPSTDRGTNTTQGVTPAHFDLRLTTNESRAYGLRVNYRTKVQCR